MLRLFWYERAILPPQTGQTAGRNWPCGAPPATTGRLPRAEKEGPATSSSTSMGATARPHHRPRHAPGKHPARSPPNASRHVSPQFKPNQPTFLVWLFAVAGWPLAPSARMAAERRGEAGARSHRAGARIAGCERAAAPALLTATLARLLLLGKRLERSAISHVRAPQRGQEADRVIYAQL